MRSLFQRRREMTRLFGGPISLGDAVFVCECIRLLRPRCVVEIGVASGFSSFVILSAMERHGLLRASNGRLISLDLLDSVDGDPARRVGQVVEEVAPELKGCWTLRTNATSLDLFDWDPIDPAPTLAFIDGGHTHPWPAVDLYVLSRRMPIGSWLIMQDIDLPTCMLVSSIRKSSPAGPGWLGAKIAYEHWLGPKVRGLDACYNVAAVQLAPDLETIDRSIRDTLSYPLERPIDDRLRRFLRDRMGAGDDILSPSPAKGTGPRPTLGKMKAPV